MQPTEFGIVALMLLGGAIQWARGVKNIPNWVSWAAVGALAFVLYLLNCKCRFDPQDPSFWTGLILWVYAARGAGAAAKDAKLAPPANSL